MHQEYRQALSLYLRFRSVSFHSSLPQPLDSPVASFLPSIFVEHRPGGAGKSVRDEESLIFTNMGLMKRLLPVETNQQASLEPL